MKTITKTVLSWIGFLIWVAAILAYWAMVLRHIHPTP